MVARISSGRLHVDDGLLDGLGIDGLLAGGHGGEHRVERDVLDEAWDPPTVVEDRCDRIGLEDLALAAGQTAGRSKRGNNYTQGGSKKALFVYPLRRHATRWLRGDA